MIDFFQAFENFSKLYDFAEVFGFAQIVLMLVVALIAVISLLINVLFVKLDDTVSFVLTTVAGSAILSSFTVLTIIAVVNFVVFPYLMNLFWI